MDTILIPPDTPPRRSTLGPLSQPVQSISNILRAGVRRRQHSSRITRKSDKEDPLPSTPIQIRAEVFDQIVKRLIIAGHETSDLNQQILSFCLPTDRPKADLWRGLLDSPFHVTDVELREMLDLQLSNTTSARPSPGQVTFYIRSFCFEAGQLATVLQDLFRRGDMSLESSTSWLEIANDVSSSLPIFIRYCGMSTTRSAWERHISDMKSKTLRPMHRFLQATNLLFPEIIKEANIFEVSRAFVAYPSDQSWVDLRERALIALLGKDTLLNSASGGKHHDTSITQSTSDDLEVLNTRTIELLDLKTTNCPPQMEREISDYVLACQKFANDQPLLTGTSSFPFTDALVTVNKHQATPAVTEDGAFTPLLMIGHDPTLTSFHGAVPFFDLDAFTTQQVVAAINSLGNLEEGQNVTDKQLARNLHAKGYLPFIDLFPWTKKRSELLGVVLQLTRQYLKATNPLIAVTWGGQVSSCATGNFKHEFGLRSAQLGDVVGVPSLQTYGDASDNADDYALIVIPSYHPNAVSYSGAAPDLFVEIFHRTMAVAWLAVSTVLSTPFSGNKREHCRRIIDQMQTKTGPNSAFGRAFDLCKDAWRLQLQRVRGTTQIRDRSGLREPTTVVSRMLILAPLEGNLSWLNQEAERGRRQTFTFDEHKDGLIIQAESERWRESREQLVMVVTCRWAKHERQSAERSQQAQEIWNLSIGALQTSTSGQTRSAFVGWARNVPTNKAFYFEAATISDMSRDIPQLLSLFHDQQATDNIEDGSWTEDRSAVLKASQNLQDWVHKMVFNPSLTHEQAIEHALVMWAKLMNEKNPTLRVALRHLIAEKVLASPKKFTDPNARISGEAVDILPWRKTNSSATLTLHWVDDQGTEQHLEDHGRKHKALCLPVEAMPVFEDDERFIFFTRDGIDIRNGFGYSLSPKGSPVTAPLYDIILQLLGSPVREKLLQLWERETGLKVDDVLFSPSRPNTSIGGQSHCYSLEAFQTSTRPNRSLYVGARAIQINETYQIAEIKKYLPLQPGDELWLLHKFFQESYPDGGVVDASNPYFWPQSDTVWGKLSR